MKADRERIMRYVTLMINQNQYDFTWDEEDELSRTEKYLKRALGEKDFSKLFHRAMDIAKTVNELAYSYDHSQTMFEEACGYSWIC